MIQGIFKCLVKTYLLREASKAAQRDFFLADFVRMNKGSLSVPFLVRR